MQITTKRLLIKELKILQKNLVFIFKLLNFSYNYFRVGFPCI